MIAESEHEISSPLSFKTIIIMVMQWSLLKFQI